MKNKIMFGVMGISAFLFTSVASAGTGCINTGAVGPQTCSTTTPVQVTVLPGELCIGTSTGSFDFGSFAVSSTDQTVNGTFTSPFFVDDLRGKDAGYYTTVQSSVLNSTDGASIAATNVYMKTPAVGAVAIALLAGTANSRVVVDAGMAAFQSIGTAKQLIVRNNAANFGVVGKYGVTPSLQVVIPAYQAVGTYTGTITYTLYEN